MVNILDKKMNNNLNNNQINSGSLDTDLNDNSLDNTQTNQEEDKGGLMNIVGECLTFAPLLYEKWSGKKLPAMGGTVGDIQASINQIATSLAQIINNQQQIYKRIGQLEVNASNQLTNIVHQVQSIQSVKLTHEKESKRIEYSQPKHLENQQY